MTVLFGNTISKHVQTQKEQLDELSRAIELFECDDIGGHFDLDVLRALRDRLTISLNNDLKLLGEK